MFDGVFARVCGLLAAVVLQTIKQIETNAFPIHITLLKSAAKLVVFWKTIIVSLECKSHAKRLEGLFRVDSIRESSEHLPITSRLLAANCSPENVTIKEFDRLHKFMLT